jgi:hypothetical protein
METLNSRQRYFNLIAAFSCANCCSQLSWRGLSLRWKPARYPNGADTVELARWCYDEPLPIYALHNVRRHCREWGGGDAPGLVAGH